MMSEVTQLEPFAQVLQRAADRKGSLDYVMDMAGHSLPNELIAKIPDDRWLAAFTKQVFQSGFVWRVVEQKWPDFERVFFDFNIEKMLMMPDEMWETKSQDPGIIRNGKKVMTIKDNAQMIFEIAAEHGSFSNWLLSWPSDNIIGIWAHIKKHGNRLGGNTGAYALRRMGFDTFLISQDNEAYFRAHKHIDGGVTSQKSQKAIQACFSQWQAETGMDYTQLSRILSFSVGDNYAGISS